MSTKEKPAKPYPEFPLFPHACGKWAKKVGGKLKYYGRWDDPDGALREYMGDGCLTVGGVCGQFTKTKCLALKTGEICQTTFADYRRTCEWLQQHFGPDMPVAHLTPEAFTRYKSHLAQRRSLRSLGNEISRVRVVFKWAYDACLLEKPLRFGPDFRKPTARQLRRADGPVLKMFTAGQIHRLLEEAGVRLRAMMLLGVNCGYGPTDCCELPRSALRDGWLVFPRPKTGVERECPLWPETLEAFLSAMSPGALPGSPALVQWDGRPFTQQLISKRFRAASRACGVDGSFYWLRHTLETVGGDERDQVALNRMMGHVDGSMAAVYRERIDPQRLVDVSEHVRRWLFGQE